MSAISTTLDEPYLDLIFVMKSQGSFFERLDFFDLKMGSDSEVGRYGFSSEETARLESIIGV